MSSSKVVIVGDGAIGKTCLIQGLADVGEPIDWSNPQYTPTAAENNSVDWEYDNPDNGQKEDHKLEIWDTAGQEALKNLRNMSYPDTDIFLIGFDMTKKESLENIIGVELEKAHTVTRESFEKEGDDDDETPSWMKEITVGCESEFMIILIGTKYDLWMDIKDTDAGAKCIKWEDGYNVAKAIDATMFISTSAKTMYGVKAGEGNPGDDHLVDEGVHLKEWILKLCSMKNQVLSTSDLLPEWPKKEQAPPPPVSTPADPPAEVSAAPVAAPPPTTGPTSSTTTNPAPRQPSQPAAATKDKDGGCCTVQ